MSIWSQTSELAAQTPADRNRYVDFLRAVSIVFVIMGHWLITTAYFNTDTGTLSPTLALDVIPWTRWLTWIFQVMPIFFIVGGYSNAISLEGAKKKQITYSEWLTGRLHRLLTPLLLLVIVWSGASFVLNLVGVDPETIKFLSRTALVPTWFLAIYTLIVLLAPATYKLWKRWGFISLAGYILLAIFSDYAFFQLEMEWLGWTNYFWVWLSMHHLGFAWRDGRLGRPPVLLAISLVSLLALMALIFIGPYPVPMAGSPGDDVSNTLPPKITLIALGLFQFGLLLSIESPMQRILAGLKIWTCTVIINTMIMTVYLWHMTILLIVLAVSYFIGGFGLTMEPGTVDWWSTRPVWLALLSILLIPVALLLSPLERVARPKDAPILSSFRLVGGAIMAGLGITLATLLGFDGNIFSIVSSGVIALVLVGAWICGISPRFSKP